MFGEGSESVHQFEESDQEANLSIPAAVTDTGVERELNEDRYAVIESESGTAWLVCDGMGGQAGGELAAQLAIDAIRRDLESMPARSPEAALRSAVQEANRVVVLRRQNQAFAGMGTTLVGAVFGEGELVIGHVGDSRAYIIRNQAIEQLTTDHTYVQQLVDSGQIKSEDALSHPQAHILTRCIGAQPGVEIALQNFWIWPREEVMPHPDYLLLCSDGLYSLVGEGEIANITSSLSPQSACVKLVELANERGGYDNITIAIVPLGGELRREPPPGFERKLPKQATQSRQKRSKPEPGSARVIGTIFLLSALAAMGVIFYVFFLLKG